jgi:GNAT superfamily N-acetyltransferase
MADRQIEVLSRNHDRRAFSCGKPPLDVFLQTQATRYAREGVGKTFVAVNPPSNQVVGYFTLAASRVELAELPPDDARKLPPHPVPTVLLGRLAVDRSFQKRGLGSELLMDATRRVVEAAEVVGIYAVHVHAIDDEARAFYEHFGFVPFLDQPRHLFLTVATIRKEFGGPSG